MPVAMVIQLLAAVMPEVPSLVADLKALFAKHPALADPAAQQAFIAALMQGAATVDDATLAKWTADQAAQPPALPKS